MENVEDLLRRTGSKQLGEDKFEVHGPGIKATVTLEVLKDLEELLEQWETLCQRSHCDQSPASYKARLRKMITQRTRDYTYTGSA